MDLASGESGSTRSTLAVGCLRVMGVFLDSPAHVGLCLLTSHVGGWEMVGGCGGGLCLGPVRSLNDRIRGLLSCSRSDLDPVHVGLRQSCRPSAVRFIIIMSRTPRHSPGLEGVQWWIHKRFLGGTSSSISRSYDGWVNVVMRSLCRSVVVKQQSWKATFSIDRLICVHSLTCGPEVWVTTERRRSASS